MTVLCVWNTCLTALQFNEFTTVLPLCLSRLGTFFSKSCTVHVADSEEKVFQQLATLGFSREGLPPALGGTWNGFDDWLTLQKCSLNESVQLDALVRNTLWAYTEQVTNSTNVSAQNSDTQSDMKPFSRAEENLIQDRKKYAHFDIRDYTTVLVPGIVPNIKKYAHFDIRDYTRDKHSGISAEERDHILRDIYGDTDVKFTVTKEMEMEGRARAQFEE